MFFNVDPMTVARLRIDSVAVPRAGVIGLTHLPGRCRIGPGGWRETRLLFADLAAIEAWGATAMVTLVERCEWARYGVTGVASAVRTRRFDWIELPIVDMGTPAAPFAAGWRRHGAALLRRLAAGERILVHCAGGLGRSGMLAARLLVAFGVAPDAAISAVRGARPGAIETAAQADFVRGRAVDSIAAALAFSVAMDRTPRYGRRRGPAHMPSIGPRR
jgi:ADP-ribosyl-[dinitrogen reductase] hydrolase